MWSWHFVSPSIETWKKKLKPNRLFQLQRSLETRQRHTNIKIEPNRYNKREKERKCTVSNLISNLIIKTKFLIIINEIQFTSFKSIQKNSKNLNLDGDFMDGFGGGRSSHQAREKVIRWETSTKREDMGKFFPLLSKINYPIPKGHVWGVYQF